MTSIPKILKNEGSSNSDIHLNTTMLAEDNTPLIILNTSRENEMNFRLSSAQLVHNEDIQKMKEEILFFQKN